jgi:citrate lyase subunit beta / citryl-CoA lyase
MQPRSLLFVPASRPDRYAKALRSGADAVIVDLEDAVAPVDKKTAREAIANHPDRSRMIVRINAIDSDWFLEDLDMLRESGIDKLMVPKAEARVLDAVADRMEGNCSIIALIETVKGYGELKDMCVISNVCRLAFGNLDFSLDAGITEEAGELDPVRLHLALESRLGNLPPPIDGVTTSLQDDDLLIDHAHRAKRLGFGGKLCIHPAQVMPVNAAFSPSLDEINWATRVMQAIETGGAGAIALDGKMVDKPVATRARAILAAVARSEDT